MSRNSRSSQRHTRRAGVRGLRFEPLEARVMLAADYSDAGSAGGSWYSAARHEAVGPILGVLRDASAAHVANALANADAQDEDGVAFGLLRAGQPGSMTVYVINAPAGARIDAWIDFNRDTDFRDDADQIVDNLAVVEGDNVITFNVPDAIVGGHYYARVRLSSAGGLSQSQNAADGEVEDYLIPIAHADSGPFAGQQPVSFNDASQAIPTDLDSDGDLDLLTSRMTWIENIEGRYGAEIPIAQIASTAVAPADVDGDGDMDFFQAGNALRWYENNGGQGFTLRTIDSDEVPSVLHAVDLDKDGALDLLAGSAQQGLRWYRNNGSQSFTAVGLTVSVSVDRTLATVDMDGDDDLDILVATTSDSPSLLWLENDGNESFTERPITSAGTNARTAQAADLDDDGDLDVIAAIAGAGGVTWYENDGAFVFTAHALDTVAWAAESAAVADLDGDGDLDIAAAGFARVGWYENDGAEAFTFRTIAAPNGTHRGVAAADIDGDGRLDLVTTGTGLAPIAWYRHVAEYDYGDAPHPYNVHLGDNGARHNAVGPTLGALRDAEADGAHAPAGAEAEDDGVLFGAITPGATYGLVTVNVQNAPAGARLDAWIDFNADGTWAGGEEQIFSSLEVAAGDNTLAFAIPSGAVPGATHARFRLSTAGGLGVSGAALDGEVEDHELTLPARDSATGLFSGPNAIAPSGGFIVTDDVDGDGDIDVASAGGRVWHENLGEAGFVQHVIATTTGLSGEDFAAHDIDADGDVDFVGFRIENNAMHVAWMENDGDQNFTLHTAPTGGATPFFAPTGLSIADIDGDGDRDVLACDLRNGVLLFLNDGQQQFASRFVGGIGEYATSVVAADMDRDGDLDVIAGGAGVFTTTADVVWFQNDGALTFTPRGVKPTFAPSLRSGVTESVAVGDMDGDGDLDVVAAGVAPTTLSTPYLTLSWHEQVADNQFVQHEIEINRNFRWATLADFDSDGDQDILASGYTGSIDLYENVGATQFFRREISPTTAALSVAAADIDGDGDLDVVAPGIPGAGLAWFANIDLVEPDYGDAPGPYPTLRADGGPLHNGGGPRLGATRDSEADGSPTPAADGDFDDGVILPSVAFGQLTSTLIVNVQNASAGARLDAWIDFNGDGSFNGAGERLFDAQSVVEGDNAFTYNIPVGTPSGSAVARFRISTGGGLRPTGAALDGEVEDYLLTIAPPDAATAEYGDPRRVYWEADSIRVADIDGDGDTDFLTVGPGNRYYFAWHENLGDGAFLTHERGFGGTFPLGVRLADFDRDGDMDFVVTAGGRLAWYENDGAEGFTYRQTSAVGLRPVFDLADVDGDGDLDVIASHGGASTQQLAIHLNDGAQGFSTNVVLTTPPRTPGAIRAADVDRDGDIDFAVTFTVDGAGWYENDNGAWTFREVTNPLEVERTGRDVVPVDFDADGDVDLMALAYTQPNLVLDLYRNDGAQSFTRETLAATQTFTESGWAPRGGDRLQVADLDGDGDLDAAAGTYEGVRIYRNDGPGPLAHFLATTGGLNPYNVPLAVADLDGDGVLEILASHDRVADTFWLDDLPFGDYNRDGAVDQADRDLYDATLGQTATPPGAGADGDRSGVVDPADLALWEANQGRGPAPRIGAADFDGNESINGRDLLQWQRNLGAVAPFPGQFYREDVDFNGAVDAGDLAVWSRQFGQGVPRALNMGESASTSSAPSTALSAQHLALASLTIVANTVETPPRVEAQMSEPVVAADPSRANARDAALASISLTPPALVEPAFWRPRRLAEGPTSSDFDAAFADHLSSDLRFDRRDRS